MVSEILALDSELFAFSIWSILKKVGALSRKLCSDGPAVVLMRVCLVSPARAGLAAAGLGWHLCRLIGGCVNGRRATSSQFQSFSHWSS